MLALPCPAHALGKLAQAQRKRNAAGASKAIEVRQAYQRVQLLGWLARLQHLHEVCCNPLLQALCLSTWGGAWLSGELPSLEDLLAHFHSSVQQEPGRGTGTQGSLLLRVCRAAQFRRGAPLELAICFVALIRALELPARLVLAFGLGEPEKRPSPVKEDASMEVAGTAPANEVVIVDNEISVDDEDVCSFLEGEARNELVRLVEMGFDRQEAIGALLQGEEDGGSSGRFERAFNWLLEHKNSIDQNSSSARRGRGSNSRSSLRPPRSVGADASGCCQHCGERRPHGAFCGNCGNRLRRGGPKGAADRLEPNTAQAPNDDDLDVTAWPEVYDMKANTWVAIDTIFGDVVAHPVVHWIHRGTPMLWLCSADEPLYADCSDTSRCRFRDVTPRYWSKWWKVEQARGPRSLQKWWETTLVALSDRHPEWPVATDAQMVDSSIACLRAAQADDRDDDFLKQRKLAGGIPQSKAALKGHERYVLGSDLLIRETIRPGAKQVGMVAASPVYRREDVARLKSAAEWFRLGRQVCEGELPIKELVTKTKATALVVVDDGASPKKGGGPAKRQLFGEWQTEQAQKKGRKSTSGVRKASQVRRTFKRKTHPAKTSSDGVCLPQLPAPPKMRKKRKVIQIRLPRFEEWLAKVQDWLELRGCLPWEKSQDASERKLAAWVRRAQTTFGKSALPRDQAAALEELEGWTWGEAAAAAAAAEEAAREQEAAGSSPKRKKTSQGASADAKSSQHSARVADEEEVAAEQWRQHVMQKLTRDLAATRDPAQRRLRLRQWQRMYHPDKNPGKVDEVMPIFRWVQACWDQEFRSSDLAAGPPGFPDAERSPPAKQPKSSAAPAASSAPATSAPTAVPRRRLIGKRRPGA